MFTGCGIALQVPTLPSGAVDEPGLRRILRRQAQAGIDFAVPPPANHTPEASRDTRSV
jgi:dihydrodipicolinate synthase/N-acetylneuraminate lyase